ncbi:hypothetical protein [Altericroceibacterium endophyticum]|uniref:Uncharacterized protein n=1 Tax=Altericroceibacterium endophyticum TaxID=1808508 RepID=A0A6I4TA58_9SPHN|nr:hypothetical protein [Altericroceibacterium endophyticum]MXO67182.1 hypothetical protein [Altericroceibacterium endophyticum]
MSSMTLNHPFVGEPIVPFVSHPVQRRIQKCTMAIGAMIHTRREPWLAGCAVAPFAGFVMTGTSCNRPLLLPEGRALAELTGHDALLLRHDAIRGTSFDMLLRDHEDWLFGYVAWRRRGSELWLIPTAGEGAFIRATGRGLVKETDAPFLDADERRRGIIRAIERPSFEGSL